MMRAVLLMTLLLGGCRKPLPIQLWYWHHSYLTTQEALEQSKALVDRAAAAGYTGMALWDSSLVFVSRADWPSTNTGYLKALIDYAHSKGLSVMPAVLPYGHSDDVLKRNPDWAEGRRVTGAKFRRKGDDLQLVPAPLIPLEEGRFAVEPWHQYEVRFRDGANGAVGAADALQSKNVRLDDVAHPGTTSFTFNSADSTRIKIYGPTPFTLREVGLVKVIRREGAPLRVYSELRTFVEGRDYIALPVKIPPQSGILEGEEVYVDYYSATTVYGEGLGMCLTDRDVERWAAENIRVVLSLLPAGSPLFLQYDEMRHINSCESCKRLKKTPGELLAWHLRGLLTKLPPNPIYVWSDMFDPQHNAHDNYYYVEGDLKGSWEGLPAAVTVVNWNGGHRRTSLEWFARRGNPQIIAGFYDPQDTNGGNAARSELSAAKGIRGIQGLMYTTWTDNYSQLEAYARAARAEWSKYQAARPW